jgi:hypothetical protein
LNVRAIYSASHYDVSTDEIEELLQSETLS